ncbi:DMT family transporter [Patescibacteria group bacterium]|nr:DMT family transporter [Patescibacteria group bacterium]
MIYPLIAAVIDSVALVLTKRSLNIFKQLTNQAFAFWIFLFIVLVGLITLPWSGHIDPTALSFRYIILILVVVVLAANYNLLYYYSLKHKRVSQLEPLLLFTPLLTIFIAGLAYPDERAWQIYLAGSLAIGLLIWSRWHAGKLKWDTATWSILGFAVLYGIEVVIIRQLLDVYSPVSLYLVRCSTTALFLWILARGRMPMINWRQAGYLFGLAVSAVVVTYLVYSSYQMQGIGATVMVLILSPVLIYTLSAVVLKEKISSRDIIASIGVVLLVLWASLSR